MTQTFPTGGLRPSSGFAGDFTGNGFTDLVVGNDGDGRVLAVHWAAPAA